VIAADGDSSQIRSRLDVGFVGRTYEDRWVVIDTKVHRGWDSVDRLRFHCDPARPAVDCPTPLGHHRWEFPVLPGENEQALVSYDYIWQLLRRYGRTRTTSRFSARSSTATMCASPRAGASTGCFSPATPRT
jgi:3-(3-hydroxy-phenyl)propionate hydroxylase